MELVVLWLTVYLSCQPLWAGGLACERVFQERETTEITRMLEDRGIRFVESGDYLIIHRDPRGLPIEHLAWWTKQMLGADLMMLSHLTSDLPDPDDDKFVIYWPKLLIKLCETLKSHELQDLIWNDLMSRRRK